MGVKFKVINIRFGQVGQTPKMTKSRVSHINGKDAQLAVLWNPLISVVPLSCTSYMMLTAYYQNSLIKRYFSLISLKLLRVLGIKFLSNLILCVWTYDCGVKYLVSYIKKVKQSYNKIINKTKKHV